MCTQGRIEFAVRRYARLDLSGRRVLEVGAYDANVRCEARLVGGSQASTSVLTWSLVAGWT